MFVLIEVNHDGCFDSTCLNAASESRHEIEQTLVKRWKEAIVSYTRWRGTKFGKNDRTYVALNPDEGYASFGFDGEGEVVEWYVFDTNDEDTTF